MEESDILGDIELGLAVEDGEDVVLVEMLTTDVDALLSLLLVLSVPSSALYLIEIKP